MKTSVLNSAYWKLLVGKNQENIEQLFKLAKERLSLKDEKALKYIMRLTNYGKIKLKEPSRQILQRLGRVHAF